MRLHQLIDPIYDFITERYKGDRPKRGVLVVSAGGLGDTVLFSRVVDRFMGLARNGEPVTLMLRSDARAMAFLFPPEIIIETVDYKRLRQPSYRYPLFEKVRRAGYRLVIHTDYLRHPDLDEALVRAAKGDDVVAMVPRPSPKHDKALAKARRFYSRWVETGPPLTDKIVRWARFAQELTGQILPAPNLVLDPEAGPPAVHVDHPVAVLQPFSAVTLKQSPVELWNRIIAAIPPQWEIKVAGHPNDLSRNPAYQILLDHPNVQFEGVPFAQLAGILRGAQMVISVDTACLHLAAILGAPTLCLASAAYVGEIMPYAAEIMPPGLTVHHASCPAMGCLGQCVYPPERGMYPCVAALDPEAVVGWVRKRVSDAE